MCFRCLKLGLHQLIQQSEFSDLRCQQVIREVILPLNLLEALKPEGDVSVEVDDGPNWQDLREISEILTEVIVWLYMQILSSRKKILKDICCRAREDDILALGEALTVSK
jgi:hypothetical protein